jgi:hypothetical protein
MSKTITLELPESLAERAKEAAQRTNRPLETVLTEWMERGAASESIAPLIPGAEYPVYTPYGNEAAAKVLYEALKAAEARNNSQYF